MASGTRPSLPDTPLTEDYLPVLEIFYACTEAEPAKRPSAALIVNVLDSMESKKENTEGKISVVRVLHPVALCRVKKKNK